MNEPPPTPDPLRRSIVERLKRAYRQAEAWLVEPGPRIQSPAERSRARLLSILLLVIFVAMLLRNLVAASNRGMFVIFALLTLAIYFLARTRYYPVAAWALILTLTAPTYVQIASHIGLDTASGFFVHFAWLAFSIVLCGLIESDEAVALLTGLNIAGALLAAAWLPEISFIDALPAASFLAILGVLVITATRQRAIIEREHHSQELDRERKLNEVGRAITQALDINIVLETVTQVAAELTQADGALLNLLSVDGERLEQALGYRMPVDRLQERPSKGTGLAWWIIQNRQSLMLDEYGRHPAALPEVVQSKTLHAYLGAPVLVGEVCLGALAVTRLQARRKFGPHDQEILEAVALQAGIAIQNARLYTALRQRDTILEAMAQAASQFLQSQGWHASVQTMLAQLGRITRSSHAYIFQNHPDAQSKPAASQIYQWNAPDSPSTLERAELQNLPLDDPGSRRWCEAMRRGRPFAGVRSAFSADEQRYLLPLGGLSLLEAPVYLRLAYPGDHPPDEIDPDQMEWWGTIGLDDYTQERTWSPAEVDAICIAASILGGAIQRQRAEQAVREREDIYRRAISAAGGVPYFIEYRPTRFTFLGEGILQLTGYSVKEMDAAQWNRCVEHAIPLDKAAGLSEPQAQQMARDGQLSEWRCDYLFRTRAGELRWISDTGVELLTPAGPSRGCIGILFDITDRRLAEQAAQRAQAQLEKQVQERTAALELANKEMEAFAYSVSHDLRAPLRAIDGYSHILLEDYRDRLEQDGVDCLYNVRQSTQKMNQLIDDLLQLSRITRREMQTEVVNLSALAEDLLGALRQQEPERGVRIRVQPGLAVSGDPNLLRIALGNLLGNAWKFTRKTSDAQIEFGCLPAGQVEALPTNLPERQAQTQVFYVRDNGAGFDMKYIAKLFQAFQRLHTPEEFEGTGIGLVTVQRIIRRHQGWIWARGAPGQGATFYFTLNAGNGE